MEILAHRRDVAALHPLDLQPQHHHHVGAFEAVPHVGGDLDTPAFQMRRQQRRRADQPDVGTQRQQQQNVRARDPRMQQVAADRHGEPGDAAFAPADGEGIQQRLGRVLVAAVAGIDHRAAHVPRQQGHGTAVVVADHQHVGMHGVERHRRVDQRLALLDRGRADRHVDDVGTQPLAGQLERGQRPGRVLEEQVDLRQAAQQVELLFRPAAELGIGVGPLQQILDLVRFEALDAEEVLAAEAGAEIVHVRPLMPRATLCCKAME